MPFLPPNQKYQSTKGKTGNHQLLINGMNKNHTHTNTHTHRFNGPFSGTTRLSWYQKGKTNLDFTEVRESECRQWQQLGHIQVCTLLQADNHQHPTSQFFTGRMPFLPPNQQCESTDGKHDSSEIVNVYCSQPYEEYTRYWQITF